MGGAPMGLEAENLSGEMMTEAYIRQLPGGVDALGGAGLDAAPGGIAKCADSEALLARSVDSWCWDDLSTPQSAEARASSALNASEGSGANASALPGFLARPGRTPRRNRRAET